MANKKNADGLAGLDKLPKKVRDAVLDAREELIALPADTKAELSKALEGYEPARAKLPEDLAGRVDALREMMAENSAIKSAFLTALASKQRAVLTPEKFTGETKKTIIQAFRKLEAGARARLGDALKTGNCEGLDNDSMQLFALVCFFVTIDEEARRELAAIFGLTAEDLQAITARVGNADKLVMNDDRQLLLPGFEDMEEDGKAKSPVFQMTEGTHGINTLLPIAKLAQKVQEMETNSIYTIEDVIPAGKKQDAISITASLDIPEECSTNRKITLFDRMVEDAIGNLIDDGYMKNGTMYTSAEVVYREMNGLTAREYVSAEGVRRVDESIRKLAKTWCVLDCKDQLLKINGKLPDGWGYIQGEDKKLDRFEGNIIRAYKARISNKAGRVFEGWAIQSLPMIYTYSKWTKQIATLKKSILATKKISNTPEVMQMRYYLLQQVERIRNNHGNIVLYDSIFEATGDTLPMEKTGTGRTTRTKRIKAIKTILDSFKEDGHINGWSEYGAGNRGQVRGVTLDVPARNKKK